MKISEILEMTQQKTIAEIAKESLDISEKTARQALKRAGCYSIVGKNGWYFDESENPENLDESIYYFADQVKKERNSILKDAANVQTYKGTGNGIEIPRKRHSFDLDVRLVKELKLKCVRDDITLYEAVEDAIRAYLKEERPL